MLENGMPRRLGLGRTWADDATINKAVSHPVLIRRGSLVSVGRMMGSFGHPHAFVWTEETRPLTRVLVIRPGLTDDWLWEDGSPVDLHRLFSSRQDIRRLANTMNRWSGLIQKHWQEGKAQYFFWGEFHAEGKNLARRLQALLVDTIAIRYCRPEQDPLRFAEEEMEF